MKQVPFSLDCFGPDGLLKEGYCIKPISDEMSIDFIKVYGRILRVVYSDGVMSEHDTYLSSIINYFKLYRRTRTAEEVAKTIPVFEGSGKWDDLPIYAKQDRIACVQAGMDEMTGCNG